MARGSCLLDYAGRPAVAAIITGISAERHNRGSRIGLLDEEPRGCVGSGALPVLLVASPFFMAMSFFELP
jgi:hypothetical protein